MTTTRRGAGPFTLRRTAEGREPGVYDRFELVPLARTIGAQVHGVDLARPLDDATVAQLRAALDEWKVLFWRDQDITLAQHAAVADRFGRLVDDQLDLSSAVDPVDNVVVFTRDAHTTGLENEWHTDGTFRPVPTAGTLLRAIEVPALGGDTLFADMAAAYDNLDDDLRARVATLTARHDWSINAYAVKYGDRLEELRASHPPVEHPVVVRHPRTGRPTLFVNRLFTREIVGVPPAESEELLDALCALPARPELQVRWHWEPGSVALWDNLAVNHYAVNDYFPDRRTMVRATFFSREVTSLEPV